MKALLLIAALLLPALGLAEPGGIPAVSVVTGQNGEQTFSLTLQILAVMTALTLLPGIVLSMTAFTRVIIVLSIVRQALGTPQTPPNQVLIGLSLFLTFFIMSPVLQSSYEAGLEPYMEGEISAQQAVTAGVAPLREFMLGQTRESDLATFARIAGDQTFDSPEDVPMSILIPSFLTSELKTAFQIGFLIFVPFVVIDLVVASVLMSMGMMMLSPMLISLPFKIMLFVMVDGWSLLMTTIAGSFFR